MNAAELASKTVYHVENYTLRTATGQKIRIATRIVFTDGTTFPFIERMSHKQAIRNLAWQIERDAIRAAAA